MGAQIDLENNEIASKRPSGGMADAQDLKSCLGLPKCGFESRLGY